MTKQTWTPGPWHADGIHVGSDRYIVAQVSAFEPREEHEANARLISLAPEMVEALRQIRDISHATYAHDPADINTARWEIASAILAKLESAT